MPRPPPTSYHMRGEDFSHRDGKYRTKGVIFVPDDPIRPLIERVGPHLSPFAYAVLFERTPDGWLGSARFPPGAGESLISPGDDALTYAAARGAPTYLPEGEESSDFCLLEVQATIYLPLEDERLLYVVAPTAEAYSRDQIQAAWSALTDLRPFPSTPGGEPESSRGKKDIQ